jgi:hypothetical protein
MALRHGILATCSALLLAGCGTAAAPHALAPTPEPTPEPAASSRAGQSTTTTLVLPPRGAYRHTGRGEFRWRMSPVTAARLGSSHRAGCPTAVADLRLLQVTHLGFDGRPHTGELVVHRAHAVAIVQVFRTLHDARFPVQRMVTVDRYGGDDDRSMAANNTSAYNCRTVAGGRGWSEHAYGAALDINPVQNPYVRGTSVEPEGGRAYLDRSDVRPGMVVAGDVVVRAFAAAGWEWGGDFRTLKDYQHFSASGR